MNILHRVCCLTILFASVLPVHAEEARTGRFTVRFEQRSPLSERERVVKSFAPERVRAELQRPREPYELKDVEYHLYVPESYREGDPHGVVFWDNWTELSDEATRVLAQRKLIWVTYDASFTPDRYERIGLVIDGLANVARRYTVDKKRILAGGRNDSGVAVLLGLGMPDVFCGVITTAAGLQFYDNIDKDDKVLGWLPKPAAFAQARKTTRFAFILHPSDNGRHEIVDRGYRARGFKVTTLDAESSHDLMQYLEAALDAVDPRGKPDAR